MGYLSTRKYELFVANPIVAQTRQDPDPKRIVDSAGEEASRSSADDFKHIDHRSPEYEKSEAKPETR